MKKSNACHSFARLIQVKTNWAKALFGSAFVVASALVLPNPAQAQVNKLANPGFESTPNGTGWVTTGNQTYNNHPVVSLGATYYNAGECPSDPTAEPVSIHGGNNVANVFGPYFSNPSTAGWTQTGIPAAAGSTWNASGWAYASHEDLSGPNQFHFEADYYNASGTLIAAYESYVVENLTCGETTPFPLDTWVFLAATNEMQVTGGANTGTVIGNTGPSGTITAPPGTASVGFQAVFVNINYAGGSMYLDDCALNFLSGPVPPTLTPTGLNNLTLCTNTAASVTATAEAGNTISSFQVISTTSQLGSAITTTTTSNYSVNSSIVSGLGTGTATINYPLTTNLNYTLTITATDNTATTAGTGSTFDTVSPNLVIEATDFNFSSGGFLDTPKNGGVYLYAGAQGNEGTDEHKNCSNPSTVVAYRAAGDEVVIQDAGSVTFNEQKFIVAGDPELVIDYTCSSDWFDYTRTYGAGGSAPAGTYDVWLCLGTSGSGPQASLSLIAGDPTSPSQSPTVLGNFGTASFSENSWAGYEYVPLTDQYGNLVATTIPSGEQTLRISQIANPNLAFIILMPVAPKLTPSLAYEYPDGAHPFEATNHLTFTVNPANGASIASSGIHMVLNGVDVTSAPGFSLTQSGSAWTASYPVQSNEVYTAALNVTNTSGLFSIFPVSFDTFDINNYQWEAVDYDFSTNNGTEWISALFIDNPVPSCDNSTPTPGNMAANSYYIYPTDFNPGNDPTGNGAVAQQGIDINFGNVGQSYPSSEIYRADGVGSQPANDYVRPKFLTARTQFGDVNIGPVNIGYYATGFWLNYTRHWPTNNYYVWGRLASGGAYSGTSFAAVTAGVGTATQTTNVLGTFSDPNASGYQSWHWIPLLDGNGNKVVVSLGGQATFRVTSTGLNTEFFMLVKAPPQFNVTATLVSGQVKLSFPTVAGHTYTVLYSSSLSPQAWSQVGSTIPGDGTVHTVSESPSGTQGYYVVSATP